MNPSDYRLPPPCPRSWQSLAATPDSAVRHCDDCDSAVHWVATPAELAAQAKAGRCVAMAVSAPDDPTPQRAWVGFPQGMIFHNVWLTKQSLTAQQVYCLSREMLQGIYSLYEIRDKAAREEILVIDNVEPSHAKRLIALLAEQGIQARMEVI